MYVRDARNRDEAWLLDNIEAMELDDAAFRSRDYVVAVDDDSDSRAGFGRLRFHPTIADPVAVELTSIGVLEGWRDQGVGAHVIERLVETAGMEDFEQVYSITGEPDYLAKFGFSGVERAELPEPIADRVAEKRDQHDPDALAMTIDVEAFSMAEHHREAFKQAAAGGGEPTIEETAEDFGIDSETATYKYDTGRD